MNISRIALIVFLTGMCNMNNALAGEFEGAGIRLCSEYSELRKTSPSDTSNIFFDWAEGFMSGLNVARLNDTTGFKSMTAEQQEAQIQQFCDAHPTEKYFKAVIDLYTTIYPKQKS